MTKGRVFHDPQFRYARLTDYLGHSNHLYFTDPCWLAGNRSMLFTSDRENQSNLFRYDLDTATITQVTDLRGSGRPGGCFSAANQRHYFWWERELHELDPMTLEERVICRAPEGMTVDARANPTADGTYVCTRFMVEPPQDKAAIPFSYSRFREFFHAKPLSQIVRIDVATGAIEVVHEDRCYIGHINTSPTLPDIMTFCHEGPWDLVDQRIWGLDITSGKVWRIRSQEDNDVSIGHEYWFADGLRMGYHGRPRASEDGDGKGHHVFGWVRWDDTERHEEHFPFSSTHFHSHDQNLIVGDGTPAYVFTSASPARAYIQLFQWDGERYVGPRILAYHRSTFNNQHAHPHPRFTPDGKSVLYSSDLTSYSNMYMVRVGEFDDLPEVE
ncbi:MAG: oligogalacturonate lyase family protein [Anaerolineae bacterium]|nr:oligogalacturonate lyase family protein [Anaerolineae bacterium]